MNFFIGFQHSKTSPVTSKTIEEIMTISKSESLTDTFKQIDQALLDGDDDKVLTLKSNLPCVVWNRSYPEGAKRKKDTGTPTGIVMMDWDNCETEEQLQALVNKVWQLALTNDFVKDHLLAAHISPRRHGIHCLWGWVDGCTSIEQVQERVAHETGLGDYDPSCKDNSRISFLVSEDRFFYRSQSFYDPSFFAELQAKQEILGKNSTPKSPTPTSSFARTAPSPSTGEQEGVCGEQEGVSFPSFYNGLSYSDIISALLLRICKKSQISDSGTPVQGNRHLTWLKCCSHLRTITDNNPQWLYQIAPQWAFDSPGNNVMQTCIDATSEKMTYGISKTLQNVIDELDSQQYKRDEDGKLLTESWLEYFKKNHTRPVLPPMLQTIMDGMPEPYYEATLAHLICMFASICFSKVRARYLDGMVKAPNMQVIIEAPSQSGKGKFKDLYEILFRRVKANDDAKLERESEYKIRTMQKMGVEKLDEPPHFVMQTAGINISATKLADVARNNHDAHLYVFEEEIITVRRELRKSYGIQYDHIRKAFDNGEVYQNNKSASSATARYKVFLNYTFTGTVEDSEKFINGEIEGGTANRILWSVIPEQSREGYNITLPDDDTLCTFHDQIDKWIDAYVYTHDQDGTDIVRDTIEIDLSYLFEPLQQWLYMQYDYAETESNKARQTVRFRYALMGFVAGMVAHMMWGCPDANDSQTRSHIINLARYFASMGIERYLHKFADDQNTIYKQSKKKEYRKSHSHPLELVEASFSKKEFEDAMNTCGMKSPLRIILCKYKKQGFIKSDETRKGRFIKLI